MSKAAKSEPSRRSIKLYLHVEKAEHSRGHQESQNSVKRKFIEGRCENAASEIAKKIRGQQEQWLMRCVVATTRPEVRFPAISKNTPSGECITDFIDSLTTNTAGRRSSQVV